MLIELFASAQSNKLPDKEIGANSLNDIEYSTGNNVKAITLGDVNGDKTITVTDVTFLINYILNKNNANFVIENADINYDGAVNVTDVTELVNVILNNIYNIENNAIKAFRQMLYDDDDYSYTWMPNMLSIINFPDYDQPSPVVLDVRVDESIASRTLFIADNHNFDDVWEMELDLTSTTKSVYNLEPQKWYWWKVCKDDDPISILDQGKFFCDGQVRELRIGANYSEGGKKHKVLRNVRDIGGWPVEGGGRMRYGILLRGHSLNADKGNSTYITEEGKAELLRLGVRMELELRSASMTESVLGDTVEYVKHGIEQWFYRMNIYRTQLSFCNSFSSTIRSIIKAAREGKTIYAHCAGGADRTGALCTIIEGLCGVSENDINHDYELSNRDRSREYYKADFLDMDNNRDHDVNYDGDFKYAMMFIKGLARYNNHIYTKYQCYADTYVTIGGVDYKRNSHTGEDGRYTLANTTPLYFRWTHEGMDYYTTDKYPTTASTVYELDGEDFVVSDAVITKLTDKFWYDAQQKSNGRVRITDTTLINALDAQPIPPLMDRFALLMQLSNNGLTNEEIEELRNIFISRE